MQQQQSQTTMTNLTNNNYTERSAMRSPSKTRDNTNSFVSGSVSTKKLSSSQESSNNASTESTSSNSSLTNLNNINNVNNNNNINSNNDNEISNNTNNLNIAVDSALRKYGWLYKLSQNGLKLWRKRYFVLTDYILDYYSGNLFKFA
jgi:hypothetical protein